MKIGVGLPLLLGFVVACDYPGLARLHDASGLSDTQADGRPVDAAVDVGIDAPDTTPPTISSTVPVGGSSNVSRSTNVQITFSEPVLNVDGTSFVLKQGSTPEAGTTITMQTASTYLLTPGAPLAANTTYSVYLYSTITDTSGNALGNTSFDFITAL